MDRIKYTKNENQSSAICIKIGHGEHHPVEQNTTGTDLENCSQSYQQLRLGKEFMASAQSLRRLRHTDEDQFDGRGGQTSRPKKQN